MCETGSWNRPHAVRSQDGSSLREAQGRFLGLLVRGLEKENRCDSLDTQPGTCGQKGDKFKVIQGHNGKILKLGGFS